MGKGVYRYYKNRLIEIGGNNKCLYLKNVARKSSYDIGRILEARDRKLSEFSEFLWSKDKRSITLISSKEKSEILENLDVQTKFLKKSDENTPLTDKEKDKLKKLEEKYRRASEQRAIESEITRLKELKRELEEIERETGKHELYIGYPFVFGMISQGFQKTPIKAPLLLFPVKIELPDENTVEIVYNDSAKIHINPAFIFAYSQSKKIPIGDLELEFDSLADFDGLADIIEYLARANIKIDCISSKNIYCYSKFKEPQEKELSIRYAAVMARFPLSNSIYNDYTALQKKKLTNDAISELLLTGRKKSPKNRTKSRKAKRQAAKNYTVKMLDYAQLDVVKKSDEHGNMVIYGPPGTGKSQTIVNVITDALCKGKRVLVVSQKKAALDVVYNRLGSLNGKAIYVSDEYREKRKFYDSAKEAHEKALELSKSSTEEYEKQYNELEEKIKSEEKKLEAVSETLNKKREFGLSLSQMYSSSYNFAKNSTEYDIYRKMLENNALLSLNYSRISDSVFRIQSDSLAKTYYDFTEQKEKNPLFDFVFQNLDLCTLGEARGELESLMHSTKKKSFNLAEYPLYSKVLAYYGECDDEKKIDRIIKMEAGGGLLRAKKRTQMKEEFVRTLSAINTYVKDYSFLGTVFKKEGCVAVIDNIVRGNYAYLKNVYAVLVNYISSRDTANLIASLSSDTREILDFAYENSKNYQSFTDIIGKIPIIRIYHEIIYFEEHCKNELSLIVDFPNITARIYKYKEQQLKLAASLVSIKSGKLYAAQFEEGKDSKNYLYQITKTQKYWPIRKLMENFGPYLLKLFPCWLLSPENVSNLLPLEKNLFDTVIFDEASQVFIESTIPSIYRGKSIVVAGDAKQLRPSTTFMKRYLGADPELEDDLSLQAALEVESLLDLAVSRYKSANLTYHYRSKHSELIDFSNNAFYNASLKIAPNTSKNKNEKPIERYKVAGKWIDRQNPAEAAKVVEILKNILKTRKNNESIGIITFNSDQQSCISDLIDKECSKDTEFRSFMNVERHRIENGEDVSIFVKNLENVQGDERDIVIFSIAYAKNEEGKVYTNFGSLSADGGENRLNVAITRAKSKIIVVTSIEPEELKVDGAKNLGPRLLKSYLAYVRSVSDGNTEETSSILKSLNPHEEIEEKPITSLEGVDLRIKEKLEKLGYKVELRLGNSKNKISLAVYDEKSDKYLVGVQLDTDAYKSSDSVLERDVYNPKFLEERGWSLIRVWCRDWWLSPHKVIKRITSLAESNKT